MTGYNVIEHIIKTILATDLYEKMYIINIVLISHILVQYYRYNYLFVCFFKTATIYYNTIFYITHIFNDIFVWLVMMFDVVKFSVTCFFKIIKLKIMNVGYKGF